MLENIYDGFDRVKSAVDAVGGKQESTFDPGGRVIKQIIKGTIGGATPPDRSGGSNKELAISQTRFNEGGWAYEQQQQIFIALDTPIDLGVTAAVVRTSYGGLATNSVANDHTGSYDLTDFSGLGLGQK